MTTAQNMICKKQETAYKMQKTAIEDRLAHLNPLVIAAYTSDSILEHF